MHLINNVAHWGLILFRRAAFLTLLVGSSLLPATACELKSIERAFAGDKKFNPEDVLRKIVEKVYVDQDCDVELRATVKTNLVDGIDGSFLIEARIYRAGNKLCLLHRDVEPIDRKKYGLPNKSWFKNCVTATNKGK